jgi:hypothetical protein
MWPRWKKRRVLAYAHGGDRICARSEIDAFLAAPPRLYMGGEVSGSGPSRLQVDVNPN